jgi:multiple antibiotic resistance protein
MLDYLTTAFVTIFVTVDPPGVAPLFLALTAGLSREERRVVAWRGVATATLVLIFFAVAGEILLRALGISIAAFRTAGGLLLFYIAFEMVFAQRTERKAGAVREPATAERLHAMAVFPVAIPLLAGPGAISATILAAAKAPNPLSLALFLGALVVVMAIALAAMLSAGRIDRALGATGRAVVERLLGLILSALAVQFVADGIKALIAA